MITENISEFKVALPKFGRLLAIDFGDKKMGIATCDSMQIISSAHSVYIRRNMSKDLGHLNKIITDEEVVAIVMGLPLELSGEKKEACDKVVHFANKLNKKTQLNIFLQDERLSTVAVNKIMLEQNIQKNKRQNEDDKIAASYIMQGFLDRLNNLKTKDLD